VLFCRREISVTHDDLERLRRDAGIDKALRTAAPDIMNTRKLGSGASSLILVPNNDSGFFANQSNDAADTFFG